MEGDSVSITCYYPTSSVNRHSRKFWCREEESGRCVTLASTGYTSQEYSGRGKLTDYPAEGKFEVNISEVNQKDSGSYKCGIGVNGRGLDFGVNVLVSPKPQPSDDVYKQYESYTVTIKCPFKPATRHLKKSFYKVEDGDPVLIIDSTSKEPKDPRYKGRITLEIQSTTAEEFTVTIKHLKLSDAGQYVCQSGSDPEPDKQNVDLRLLTPGLLYGNLGGSVTFECALDSEEANPVASLRQVRNGNVVIDSQGTIDPAFEGRILFTKAENGHFSVVIAGLRKEDTGDYQCAYPDGQSGDGPPQLWQLFVNEVIDVSRSPPVLKGFPGGSVTIRCPYDPKKSDSPLQLYLWEGSKKRHLLVDSGEGLVQKDYTGRLALFKEPGNGTFSVILSQLNDQDGGFYWCASDDDKSLTTSVELQIVNGEPSPTIDEFSAVKGQSVEITCHFPCKYFSSEKYWCKWNDHGCEDLPTKLSSSDDLVKCNNNLVLTLTLDSVSEADEGWYWCGAKDGHEYKEVAVVKVEPKEPAKVAVNPAKVAVDPAKAAPAPVEEKAKAVAPSAQEKAVVPIVKEAENKVVQKPRLLAEEVAVQSEEDPASGSRASVDTGSASGQSGSAKVLISTLVPLGLVLAVGAMAVAIARARHRRNVDRVSIGSYRTDISMSDLENSREFGAIDNPSACPDARETALGGKDELATATESTVEIEEPKKAKRSSKEEADMAYSAFLLQSNTIAAEHQDGPKEA